MWCTLSHGGCPSHPLRSVTAAFTLLYIDMAICVTITVATLGLICFSSYAHSNLKMVLSLKEGLCQSQRMRHEHQLHPAFVYEATVLRLSLRVLLCWDRPHQKKPAFRSWEGHGDFRQRDWFPWWTFQESPKLWFTPHRLRVSFTKWNGNFSKNPTLLIHWLNSHSESTVDIAARVILRHASLLGTFSTKNLQTVRRQSFSVFLLSSLAALWKMFLSTGKLVSELFSLLLALTCAFVCPPGAWWNCSVTASQVPRHGQTWERSRWSHGGQTDGEEGSWAKQPTSTADVL